jgi:HlyD family secretion protein
MKRRTVAISTAAVLVVAALSIAFTLRGHRGDELTVQVQPVERRTIVQKVSAKITRLTVKEGEWVEKGTLLVELDRERYVAALESAEANLRAAEANANLARENMVKAEKDWERTDQLFAKHLESQAMLDTAYAAAQVERARYQSTRDQAAQAAAAVKEARDALSKTTIYAPIAGTVSRLNKEVGEIALGSQFQEDVIMELSNLTGMEALVNVDENDIVLVSLADRSEIDVDALPDLVLHGEVTEIASSAKISSQGTSDQKTEFEVKIGITDPAPSLRPGMTASGDIVTEVHEGALSVPIQAVAVRTPAQLGVGEGEGENGTAFTPDRDGFVQIVWVVVDGVAEARQVTTGIQGENHIEILGGLEEGDQIVVGSYRAISRDLSHKAPVKVGPAEARRG